MRIGVVEGRTAFLRDGRYADAATVSGGKVLADPTSMYTQWKELNSAYQNAADEEFHDLGEKVLSIPVPSPRQVFAVGANYRLHIEEAGAEPPKRPLIFTKFPSCLTGPTASIEAPSDSIDWEVELVAVIGQHADHVPAGHGWDYVAGLTVGQDITDRVLQFDGSHPQFSLSKSRRTFGPLGPALVTPDEFEDPDDLEIGCALNGETQQASRTSDLIFPVPLLVEYLSSVCTLYPGDLIFTGTPSGVGAFKKPATFLRPGDILTSWVEGIGSLTNTVTEAPPSTGTAIPAPVGSWSGVND
ncbi:2-keto-4-pentenoate hydratase/2-oxohepta-3-ene-1,7-dioic acid hydratase in catechol pathway [Thermocatellispora tengchongensis]|uniref:2-keto-4-pentenoate hydratase/2-oxohepta-3-ene-1,7-dioic acid hydratase in catechol pathway n=1 Tax=Thermocatellispora tengchongensis TaxID=1073253 RepID=A0A840PS19_9ACTN|nr:fumarylacetoacetate hydrolase family protein [Thermocatellispora tengchongensis]MBB5140580.1 2-keto-4-pentenoate hydratase/2-oxohepta-3-ene-1,7-dioic acid hydratase in catechol pathway [Thermocatellispora tengchongensis]